MRAVWLGGAAPTAPSLSDLPALLKVSCGAYPLANSMSQNKDTRSSSKENPPRSRSGGKRPKNRSRAAPLQAHTNTGSSSTPPPDDGARLRELEGASVHFVRGPLTILLQHCYVKRRSNSA